MSLPIKYCLPLLSLLLSSGLSACSCILEDLNESTFQRYDFVAHVRLTEIQPLNGPFRRLQHWEEFSRIAHFEVLELYRGEQTNIAIEEDYLSSCGTDFLAGEEWLVFAMPDRNGSIYIHSCSPTTIYRNKQEEPILEYGYPTRVKNWLDSLCQVTPKALTLAGPDTLRRFFPSGQLSEFTTYLNGQLHGPSQYYYANGQLMDERHYHRGRPSGLRHHYHPDGQLNYELEFNPVGQLVRALELPDQFQKHRCETLYQPGNDWETEYCYHKNGNIYSVLKRNGYQPYEEKYYNTSGQLIHHSQYSSEWEETILLDSLIKRGH